MSALTKVCVFCGSGTGTDPAYAAAARELARELIRREIHLVYGGGKVGLMGIIADAAIEAGGDVIGVMPRHLVDCEIAHRSLSQLHVVETMHERKKRMVDISDAFVLLPGGFGSWEEFCEAVTWLQLGLHSKPCGILNVLGYYDSLVRLVQHGVNEGFIDRRHRQAIVIADRPSELVAGLISTPHLVRPKWSSEQARSPHWPAAAEPDASGLPSSDSSSHVSRSEGRF